MDGSPGYARDHQWYEQEVWVVYAWGGGGGKAAGVAHLA